jgi:hypothetical protein
MVEEASNAIARADASADRIARSLTENLEIVSSVLRSADSLFDKAKRGEGTIGRLFLDDKLYEALLLTFRRLGNTTEELRLLVKEWQKGKVRIGL